MLNFLRQIEGRWATLDEIIEAVWPAKHEPQTARLSVNRIATKLRAKGYPVFSRWGVYRFEPREMETGD